MKQKARTGEIINKLRREKKIEIRTFAKLINIKPSKVHDIEKKFEPIKLVTLNNIAKILDVNVKYLMSFQVEAYKK